MVERHRREGSSLGRAKLDVAREMSLRDRVAYLTALAWPSKARHLPSLTVRPLFSTAQWVWSCGSPDRLVRCCQRDTINPSTRS